MSLRDRVVGFEFYLYELNLTLANNTIPITQYCAICYWGAMAHAPRVCPFNHGQMSPISLFYEEKTRYGI